MDRLMQGAVDGLAVVDPRLRDIGGAVFKAAVRADPLCCAVGVFENQFADNRHAVTVVVFRVFKAKGAHIPALAKQKSQFVLAFLQRLHRKGHNLDAPFIIRDAWLEVFFSQLSAIDQGVKHADAGCVKSCFFQPRSDGNHLSDIRMTAIALLRGNPVSLPCLVPLAGLEAALRFRAVARVALDRNLHLVGRSRSERQRKAFAGMIQVLALPFGQNRTGIVNDADSAGFGLSARCVHDLPRNAELVHPEAQRLSYTVAFDLGNLHFLVPSLLEFIKRF